LPAVLAAFAKASLAQEIAAGENKMFAHADSRNLRIVNHCVALRDSPAVSWSAFKSSLSRR
jgi:hypothetical protein